jgi:hypothetical protein
MQKIDFQTSPSSANMAMTNRKAKMTMNLEINFNGIFVEYLAKYNMDRFFRMNLQREV